MASEKFRISLSLDQIDWILSNADCPQDLAKILKVAKLKATEGITKPAYTLAPVRQKELSLDQKYQMACSYLNRGEQIPENLMDSYNEYRYLNDLMSAEESAEYEQTQGF